MIQLLPDQIDTGQELRSVASRCRAVLLRAETGSGKTVMASWLSTTALTKGKTVWFIVPRRELIVQTAKTYDKFNIPYSYIASGYVHNPYARAHVCSVGTLIGRLENLTAPDLAIIDETHYGDGALGTIIEWLKSKGSYIIGLSATPWKLNGRGLGCWYDEMVEGPSVRWLIDNKRLSDYKLFAPNKPDYSKMPKSGGDYAKKPMGDRLEQDTVLIGDAVRYYKEHALGMLGVTCCYSRKHSEMTAQKYRDEGISAMHIDGTTPDNERRRIIRAYGNRELLQLCHVNLLSFGFDLSAQVGFDVCVESLTDLNPTKSLANHRQKNGRVLRYKPRPAMIFDHSSNVYEHGLPCDEIEWTLSDRETKTRGEQEKTIPVRSCTQCYFSHKPAPSCPACNYVYPIQYREIDEVEGDLEEIKTWAPSSPQEQEKMNKAVLAMVKQVTSKRKMPRHVAIKWAQKKYREEMRIKQ